MPKEKQNFARYAELVSTVYRFTGYMFVRNGDCTSFPEISQRWAGRAYLIVQEWFMN
jgi:hypothetical protein